MSTVKALGYLAVRGPLAEWATFGPEVLGAQVAPSPEGEVRLRTDEKVHRIIIEDGPAAGPSSLVALGLEIVSDEALTGLVATLTDNGIEATEDPGLAARRGVDRVVRFADSDGNGIEAYVGLPDADSPFVSPTGTTFVAGPLGVGHVFLFPRGTASAAAEFYEKVLGFLLTDTISLASLGVPEEDAVFLHCNPRHHTVAVGTIPGPPPGLGHLMLEVADVSQVGKAMDRVRAKDEHVNITLGEHSNDLMLSFYVATPSGFDIEYGCNGVLIDDATWKPGHHELLSNWGHHFQGAQA
ncbi:VOC family protein [Streptomyces albicerus]|uniref:VOC family protein n=1 Tax=Streptomyces albicerus TaxID=2569859 RepID=UPI00124B250D|nr:VOC family protein [Streptomyces albicerus]